MPLAGMRNLSMPLAGIIRRRIYRNVRRELIGRWQIDGHFINREGDDGFCPQCGQQLTVNFAPFLHDIPTEIILGLRRDYLIFNFESVVILF